MALRSRYFNNVSKVRCYNCGESGHVSSECPNSKPQTCCICLEDHSEIQCRYRICRCCNRRGHDFKNCKSRTALIFDYQPDDLISTFCTQGKPFVKKLDMSEVICINCGDTGHANCEEDPKHNKKHSIFSIPLLLDKDGNFDFSSLPENSKIFCTNCGKKSHSYSDCSLPRVEEVIRNFRSPLNSCFICHNLGHQRDVCPSLSVRRHSPHQNYRSRFSPSPQYRQREYRPHISNKRRRSAPSSSYSSRKRQHYHH